MIQFIQLRAIFIQYRLNATLNFLKRALLFSIFVLIFTTADAESAIGVVIYVPHCAYEPGQLYSAIHDDKFQNRNTNVLLGCKELSTRTAIIFSPDFYIRGKIIIESSCIHLDNDRDDSPFIHTSLF